MATELNLSSLPTIGENQSKLVASNNNETKVAAMAASAQVGAPTIPAPASGAIGSSNKKPEEVIPHDGVVVVVADETERNILMNSKTQCTAMSMDRNQSQVIRIDPTSIIVANQPAKDKDRKNAPSLRIIADRCFVMRYYAVLLVLLCLLNFFLFLWGVISTSLGDSSISSATWYVALDISANILLSVEVIIRIVATHKTYWSHFWNIVDFIVMLLCLAILFLYISNNNSPIAHSSILAFRYIAQISRVYVAMRSLREQTVTVAAASTLQIDFTGLDKTEREKKRCSHSSA